MTIAIVASLFSAISFAIANIIIKKSLASISVAQTLVSNMIFGAFFLFVLVLINGFEKDFSGNLLLTCALLSIIEVVVYLSLYKAFAIADVTVASAIINTYPILTTIYTVLILGQKLELGKFANIFLMVAGAVVISIDYKALKNKKIGRKSFIKGIGWVLLSLFFHSIYFTALGKFTESGSWESRLLVIKTFSALILFVSFYVIRKSKFIAEKGKIAATVLLGFMEVCGWIGLTYASNHTQGILAIIIAVGSTAPIFTAILARLLLKEKLHQLQYLGVVISIVGTVLLSL